MCTMFSDALHIIVCFLAQFCHPTKKRILLICNTMILLRYILLILVLEKEKEMVITMFGIKRSTWIGIKKWTAWFRNRSWFTWRFFGRICDRIHRNSNDKFLAQALHFLRSFSSLSLLSLSNLSLSLFCRWPLLQTATGNSLYKVKQPRGGECVHRNKALHWFSTLWCIIIVSSSG